MNNNLMGENKMIRSKINELQDDIFDLKEANIKKSLKQALSMSMEEKEIRVVNKNLRDRFQFLKNREVELVGLIGRREANAGHKAK